MGRSPLCRKKIAAIVGAASIATMPVALAGPTTATPPPPIEPTTTTVPVPVPQQELPSVQPPIMPTPLPVQQPVVPIQPPVQEAPIAPPPLQQPVQPPAVQPSVIPVQQPPIVSPVQLPPLPSHSTEDAPVPSKVETVVPDFPKRQIPEDVQQPGSAREVPPNAPPVEKVPNGGPVLPQRAPDLSPQIQGGVPVSPEGESGARLNLPSVNMTEFPNGSSDGQHIPPPLPLPQPHDEQNQFPSWGHDHPEEGLPPVPVGHVNPPSEWHHGDWSQGNSDEHGQPGHLPPPPPVVPDVGWHDPWLEHCHDSCLPPPNPDIFVQGKGNQVVIVNNITNNTVINNTVVNSDLSDVYLTNFVTGQTLFYPSIPYHHPWGMPDGWCNGHGGDWGWSAGVGGLYVGGGVFNVDSGCGYHPYIPPPRPLVIYYQGYQPYYVNNYYIPQGCGCVYAENTYYYYQQPPQETTLPGWSQPEQVVMPYAWSPNAVTQTPIEGVPPFYYGTGRSPSYWWLLWLALGAGVAAGGTWLYRRHANQRDDNYPILEEMYVPVRT